MSTDKKTPAPTRRYVVIDSEGNELLVKATTPAAAVQQVYKTKVRVASGDDIEAAVDRPWSRRYGALIQEVQMAVYRVGQKVRIVSALDHPELIGREDVIQSCDYDLRACRYCGSQPAYELTLRNAEGISAYACPCALEPVQPEGYQVVTWAECPWQPKREELTT